MEKAQGENEGGWNVKIKTKQIYCENESRP
jgi:hypothetical protein